jgi:hypothetical protein
VVRGTKNKTTDLLKEDDIRNGFDIENIDFNILHSWDGNAVYGNKKIRRDYKYYDKELRKWNKVWLMDDWMYWMLWQNLKVADHTGNFRNGWRFAIFVQIPSSQNFLEKQQVALWKLFDIAIVEMMASKKIGSIIMKDGTLAIKWIVSENDIIKIEEILKRTFKDIQREHLQI